MYLLELVGGLRRRWWITLIGLLGTAALAWTAFTLVPPVQEVRASLMILPTAKDANEAGNPYLVLGGLEPAADMLAAAMNSGATHESLAPASGKATFEVTRDTSSSGPMLLVDVTDDSAQGALTLMDDVVKTMPEVLSDLQAQVSVRPSSNLLTLTEVTRDTKPEPSIKNQLRATLAAAAAGLAVTLFGTNALDGLLRRRAARRREERADEGDDDSAEGQEPEDGTIDDATRRRLAWADSTP